MSMNVPGYQKAPLYTPFQLGNLDKYLSEATSNMGSAAEGYKQFLPGGGGGKSIIDNAMRNYQQNTIPSIFNAYGSESKGSSALNQSLAASASDLNSDLGSKLAEMSLYASQGLGNLGLGQGQLGSKQQFAYTPKEISMLRQFLLSILGGAGAGFNSFASGVGGGLAGKIFG